MTPLPGPPRSIGSYADGCLAGAVALPSYRTDMAGDAALARPQLGNASAR